MSSNSEFKHMVRMAGKDLDGTKMVHVALTDLRGIGYNTAIRITRLLRVDGRKRIGSLDEQKLNEIEEAVKNIDKLGLPT